MTVTMVIRNGKRITTFEDLRGLRAECYVRDSTLDQRDGFGPDIQRHNEERFAQSYGLALGDRWYTEFVSGRSAKKRQEFQSVLDDARLDRFDVLLVDHTSRFGRNQAECIYYKEELQRLEKTVVFVSQGIISGSDRDFLTERINETLDEQYSRNLSRYVSAGLAEKVEHGLHVGPAPVGYKSELVSGKRERKVPDSATMPALLMALREYASGGFSFREVADHLNAKGYRMRSGGLFTGYTIRDILSNRFYEGKVVYHQGLANERRIDGCHEVPDEVRDLWLRCQGVKKSRAIHAAGHPRSEDHTYPFSRVLKCHQCGSPYHGEAVHYGSHFTLRLTHERRTLGRNCGIRPRSCSVDELNQEFGERVLTYIHIDEGWESLIVKTLGSKQEAKESQERRDRLTRALENLRKQHLWGDITDEDYRQERVMLEREFKMAEPNLLSVALPNLERAAQLLNDLPALWSHPGITNEQRESLVKEVFTKLTIDGKDLASIEPKPTYAPLFAAMSSNYSVGYCDLKPPPSPPSPTLSLVPLLKGINSTGAFGEALIPAPNRALKAGAGLNAVICLVSIST
jgi:DNA invertase Pin-like site-specific DNA recombinase